MEKITIIIEDENTIAAIEDFRKRCHIENLDYFIIAGYRTFTEDYLKSLGKLRLPDDSKILPENEEQYLSYALWDANNLLQFAQNDYDYYKLDLGLFWGCWW